MVNRILMLKVLKCIKVKSCLGVKVTLRVHIRAMMRKIVNKLLTFLEHSFAHDPFCCHGDYSLFLYCRHSLDVEFSRLILLPI